MPTLSLGLNPPSHFPSTTLPNSTSFQDPCSLWFCSQQPAIFPEAKLVMFFSGINPSALPPTQGVK